jgi:anti-sigma regulatory factor (Ser/Thr protein kinase)
MVVKELINVSDNRLLDGLVPVVRIMSQVEMLSEEEEAIIDFGDTFFITPVCALSLIVYLAGCGRRVMLRNVPDYLNTIGISNGGIKPDQMRQTEFLATMERYSTKTYIPIISFAAGKNMDDKEAISSVVENILIRQLNIRPNVAMGLKYMVEETLDNITEHSESERGYIIAQAYPRKGYLDICMADNGVTLLGSYMKLADNEIVSDLEAIKAANRGISSKNLPEAENRGYGIQTSKRMLVEGLDGQYLMISGSCIYVKSPGHDNVYSVPDGLRWNGTVVALRIPINSSVFNYINYIE